MEDRLQRFIRHEIPKGAILMTREEALEHQMDIVSEWRPKTDTWPLTMGRHILSAATAFTSNYMNNRFRRKLRLLSHGWLITALGLTIPPSALTYLFHTEHILKKLLLLEVNCPVCFESKAILMQIGGGMFLPLILIPIGNFAITAGSAAYNTPYATDWRKIIKVISSAYRPMIPQITLMFTVHALLAGFITHLEIKSYLYIQDAQHLLEEGK